MRRWYEPRKDRPDLERSAIRKRGFVGYMDMLWREFFELLTVSYTHLTLPTKLEV